MLVAHCFLFSLYYLVNDRRKPQTELAYKFVIRKQFGMLKCVKLLNRSIKTEIVSVSVVVVVFCRNLCIHFEMHEMTVVLCFASIISINLWINIISLFCSGRFHSPQLLVSTVNSYEFVCDSR